MLWAVAASKAASCSSVVSEPRPLGKPSPAEVLVVAQVQCPPPHRLQGLVGVLLTLIMSPLPQPLHLLLSGHHLAHWMHDQRDLAMLWLLLG
jgi:hypothetical protein